MKRQLVFLLLVLVVPPTSSEAASIIYTYGRSETDLFSSYLYSVDPDTGATQRIGTPHTGVFNELSSRSGDSTYIYGTFGGGASTDRAVGKINRFTGSLSLTALKTPILLDEFGDPVGLPPWQPVGFSIAPTRPDVGIILGLTTQGNTFIYEVSLETGLPLGTAILTRNRRQAIRLKAITFSETGETLFAISGNPPFSGGGFGTVDLETGLFQSFGALFDYVAGMEFDPSHGDIVASVTLGNSPLDLVRLSLEGDITETMSWHCHR